MTLTVTADSASELFAEACHAVLAPGKPAAPRGLATTEVLGATLILTDPRRRLVDLPPARLINPAFAVAEAMWILSGSDAPWIYLFNERLAEYADDGRLMGAYGPRLRRWHGTTDQLAQVLARPRADPGTRRAVIQLYDPETDARGHKDVPCTLGYRFFLRDGLCTCTPRCAARTCGSGSATTSSPRRSCTSCSPGWLGAEPWLATCVGSTPCTCTSTDIPSAQSRCPRVTPGPQMPSLATPCVTFDRLLAAVINGGNPRSTGWRSCPAVMASYRVPQVRRPWYGPHARRRPDGPVPAALDRWYHGDARRRARVRGGRR